MSGSMNRLQSRSLLGRPIGCAFRVVCSKLHSFLRRNILSPPLFPQKRSSPSQELNEVPFACARLGLDGEGVQ
jgi:hypothetical protein